MGEQLSGTLISIQVGRPAEHRAQSAADGEPVAWTSGVYKRPVTGRVRVGTINLDGDGQSDLKNHGGPDRAALLYSVDHYPLWRQDLNRPDMPYGAFGENFTVAGFSETTACLGDTLQIGSVLVQVSQPRRPCWKLSRRNEIPNLADQVFRRGWTGWYVRVLEEGFIEPGMEIALVNRPCPQWTIEAAHKAYSGFRDQPSEAHRLAACPYLSADWKAFLTSAHERTK